MPLTQGPILSLCDTHPVTELLPTLILILAVIGVATVLAQRIAIPAPILLAVAGVIWSSIPSLPTPDLSPQLILSVFLPPLLYADAWDASWRDFRRWLRPILQLAVGLVLLTTVVVGVVLHTLLPSIPWAACLLLGAIVSPTDTVAVHAVLERLRVPPRVTAILGVESLVNDATGLLLAGLAVIVVETGVFDAGSIGWSFAWIAGVGVVTGIVIGLAASALNRVLRGTSVLFTFSLAAPYLAYFLAEELHASGVLAVVIAGFVASWHVTSIEPESRVALYSAWEQLVFLLNALMFLYVGLEAPHRLHQALSSAPGIIGIAFLIAITVILTRIVWIFPAAYVPLYFMPNARRREGGYPRPRAVVLASWCGVRGAVSLAAALSIPLTIGAATPFPGRPQIVACALVVILVTLIGQGATLLPLVRWLGISDVGPSDTELRQAREAMLAAGIARLDSFCSEESCPIAVYRLRDAMTDQLAALEAEDEVERLDAHRRLAVTDEVRRAVYHAQSHALLQLRDAGSVNDKVHQELQLELDRANALLREA